MAGLHPGGIPTERVSGGSETLGRGERMTDPYGPWDDDVDEPRHGAPERRPLRDLVDWVVWRYESARLGTRVMIDVVAAVLVMAVVVAGALLLRDDPSPATVSSAGPSTTARATSTAPTVASTTTAPPATAPPTTVPPTTTTTRPRPTTTVAPPPTAPPTTAAPTPPPAPPTTAGRTTPYRSCDDARRAGALPLFEGEPGYARDLDRDRDGEACEPGDQWGWDWD